MSRSPVRVLYVGDDPVGARRLRDGGHEVVVVRRGAGPEQLAAVAVQEDVAVVAVADPADGAALPDLLDQEVVVFSITSPPGPSRPEDAPD